MWHANDQPFLNIHPCQQRSSAPNYFNNKMITIRIISLCSKITRVGLLAIVRDSSIVKTTIFKPFQPLSQNRLLLIYIDLE